MGLSIVVLGRDETASDAPVFHAPSRRVSIGRGEKNTLVLPDTTVSTEHARIERDDSGFTLVDLGSANGTVVGGVRLANGVPRLVRNGDLVRVGRVWLEIRIDDSVPEVSGPNATREIAIYLADKRVDRAVAGMRVRVVEGRDQGHVLPLDRDGRFKVGRAPTCALVLTDPDASREHVELRRRGVGVTVRDLGSKNAAFLGDELVTASGCEWPATTMLRLAGTVLALEDPIAEHAAEIARLPDEVMSPVAESVDVPSPAPQTAPSPMAESVDVPAAPSPPEAPIAELHVAEPAAPVQKRTGERLVLGLVGVILVLCLGGLAWILLKW
jgi:pSer/pThr/pTyr-binding forkhead associated (FHA) protein